ncbi:unnamed protein product [Heterobilharzia americana]|nr:unnamed protein product [Heterobilharzia americana]
MNSIDNHVKLALAVPTTSLTLVNVNAISNNNTGATISSILSCANTLQQQQQQQQPQSQITTNKQHLLQSNQMIHTLQSTQQLSSVLSGGTNVQAATGISIQQLNVKPIDQKVVYDGLSPMPPSKPGRGGHSRGGGRGSSKKAAQDQLRGSGQQQQQQQRFPVSSPVPNRYPVAQNVSSGGGGVGPPQRFTMNRAHGGVNQRFPSGLPIYTDSTVQQGMMQQTAGSDALGNPISSGTSYSANHIPGSNTNIMFSNSLLPATTIGGGGGGTMTITTPITGGLSGNGSSTGGSSGGNSNTGHHGKTSKSKSSKHMQEQNLNEEEKDAIVMQNVKNILSLQHTWNRESSHGRGSSSAASSDAHSSGNNSVHSQNGLNSFSGSQGSNSSNLGNIITSGYGNSSGLGSSQSSGNHRKPKSPKSPCRAVGSNTGHKVSPKSPKTAKASGITKTLSAPHQQHIQQQQQPQQQPSIVMAGCTGSALPSVLLTGSLQQMQYRPASNNSLQGTPQLQRSNSMQHYLTAATLASHQPQSAPGTPAYIVQRHPCGQLVASVSQQSSHGQLHTQSFPVQNPYQRTGSILTAVNTSNLGQQQPSQQQQQQQHQSQHQASPTLFVRTARQPYQQNDNMEPQSDMTIISSDGSGEILLTSNHNNSNQHHNHHPHQMSANNIIQSSNHLFQSNHQPGHNNSTIEQTHPHTKPTGGSSQPITQQLLLQSTGGSGGGTVGVGVGSGSQLIQIKSTSYTSPVQQTLLSEANHYHQHQQHLAGSSINAVSSTSQPTPTMIIDNHTGHQPQQISQSNCNLTTTTSSTPQQHYSQQQQQSIQLHIALHSPNNSGISNNSLSISAPGGGVNSGAGQVKSSPSNLPSQHPNIVGAKMSQLQQQQIQTQSSSSPTRHPMNNRQYVQQQQPQQPQAQHQYTASLTAHPTHYQQQQQQQQQQKVQLSPANASVPQQYQTIHSCYATQQHSQQQQQQPHQNQHPQQIIFQSPTGQQIIAAQHQSIPNAFGRNSTNPAASGGMLLRSVLPCSGNTNALGNGFHQNQSSLVTLATNQRAVPQLTNRQPTNKVLFQTSPSPQSTNNITIHGSQQQALHQQPVHTYPQQVHSAGIISGQQSKTNHQMVYTQSAGGRSNTQMIVGDSSSVNVIHAQNHHHQHQTNTVHSPYHHTATPNMVHGNNVDHSISPRPTHHSQVVPMSPHNHPSSVTVGGVGQPSRPAQIPVTTVVQSVNRQITCNSTPTNTPHPTSTLLTPAGPLTPLYFSHDGNPLPSRPEECLIGCVMLILGYRNVPESQKVVWRRVMRSHGAEVVLAYDPIRVTHVVIDCQLEEPDVIKQALLDQKRLVTIYWVNDILAKGRMIPPFEILHLPSPFSKEITFSFIRAQIISLTGFEGKDRQKIEVIIRQIGATFTDYLEPSNTLLVCKQPSGKKYEMAQLWGIPCINIRWLQDLYFGDLTTLSLSVPHKYLCFETSDVTISLERCTPRVQDLMVGWQAPIRLTQEVWIRSSKLSHDFANEERERKRKLETENNNNNNNRNHSKVKKSKCLLASLTDEDIKIAMSCRPRYETLLLEAEQKRELQATMKAVAVATEAASNSDPQNISESESNPLLSNSTPSVPIATNSNNHLTPNMSVDTVDDDDDNGDSGVTPFSSISHQSKISIDDNDEVGRQSCTINSIPVTVTIVGSNDPQDVVCEQDTLTIKMDCDHPIHSDATNPSNTDMGTTPCVETQPSGSDYHKNEEKEEQPQVTDNPVDQTSSDQHHDIQQQQASGTDHSETDLLDQTVQKKCASPISGNVQNMEISGDDSYPAVIVTHVDSNRDEIQGKQDAVIKSESSPNHVQGVSNDSDNHDDIRNTKEITGCDDVNSNDTKSNVDSINTTTSVTIDGIMLSASSSTISTSNNISNTFEVSKVSTTETNTMHIQKISLENDSFTQLKDSVNSTVICTSTTISSVNDTNQIVISDDSNMQSSNINDAAIIEVTSLLTITTTTTTTAVDKSNIHSDQLSEDTIRKRLATSPIDGVMDCKRRAVEVDSSDSIPATNIDVSPTNSTSPHKESKVIISESSTSDSKHHIKDDEDGSLIRVNKIEEGETITNEPLSHMDEDIIDNVNVEESSLTVDSSSVAYCSTDSKIMPANNESTGLPQPQPPPPPPICTDIRITYTAIDLESRLALTELCLQLPDCKIVDSAEEATHLVSNRLIRTPKTYMAVALGCYVVTPKWIQASVVCDETPWILSDPDSEAQLGIDLKKSISIARKRQMIGPEAGLFAGLEFWFSPGACHREMCIALIKAGHGIVRQRRPTQKMALLAQPKQLIICHEDDSHVANYLMRTKTGNKAVHHEEFILSGTLRQELDFDAYQIQYVNTLRNGLKAAVAAAAAAATLSNDNDNSNNSNNVNSSTITVIPPPTSLRFESNPTNQIHNTILSSATAVAAAPFDERIPHSQTATISALNRVIYTSSSPITLNTSCQQLNPSLTYQAVNLLSVSKSQSAMPTELKSVLSTRSSNAEDFHHRHPPYIQPYATISTYQPSNDTQSCVNQPQLTCSSELTCQSIVNNTPSSRLISIVPSITKADTNLSYLLSRPNTLDQISATNIPNTSSLSSYVLSSTVSPPVSTPSQLPLLTSRQEFVKIQPETTVVSLSHVGTANSVTDLIISVCTIDKCPVTNSLLTSNNSNNNNNNNMLPPKSSVTALTSSFDNNASNHKRNVIGNTRPSSLLLTGGPEVRQTIVHRPVTPLTAMIVAAESGVGDIMNPLPICCDTNDCVGSVSTFMIPKSSGFRGQVPNVTVSSVNLNARIAAADANAVASATAAAVSALSSSGSGGNINNTDIVSKTGLGLSVSTPGLPIRSPRNTVLTTNPFPAEIIDSPRHLISGIQQPLSKLSSSSPTVSSFDVVKNLIKSQNNFRVDSCNKECSNSITSTIIGSNNNTDGITSNDDCTNFGPILQSSSSITQPSHIIIPSSMLLMKNSLVSLSDSSTSEIMMITGTAPTTIVAAAANTTTTDSLNLCSVILPDTSSYFPSQSINSSSLSLSSSVSTLFTSDSNICLMKEQSSNFSTLCDFNYEIDINRDASMSSNHNDNSEICIIHVDATNAATTTTTTTITTACINTNINSNSSTITIPLSELDCSTVINDDICCNNVNNNLCTVQSTIPDEHLCTSYLNRLIITTNQGLSSLFAMYVVIGYCRSLASL